MNTECWKEKRTNQFDIVSPPAICNNYANVENIKSMKPLKKVKI